MSRADVIAGVLALVCPYCGATLTINQETVGPAYLTEEKPESIECYASDCEAVWEPNGVPRDAPRWLRYPDLYAEPQRAKERAARTAEPAAEQAHAAAPTDAEAALALREVSVRGTPGVWRQEFYRDGELLPDGTGGMDDYETAGAGVYVIDETSDEGYCLTEFSAGSSRDAALIVAAVNDLRARLRAALTPADHTVPTTEGGPHGG